MQNMIIIFFICICWASIQATPHTAYSVHTHTQFSYNFFFHCCHCSAQTPARHARLHSALLFWNSIVPCGIIKAPPTIKFKRTEKKTFKGRFFDCARQCAFGMCVRVFVSEIQIIAQIVEWKVDEASAIQRTFSAQDRCLDSNIWFWFTASSLQWNGPLLLALELRIRYMLMHAFRIHWTHSCSIKMYKYLDNWFIQIECMQLVSIFLRQCINRSINPSIRSSLIHAYLILKSFVDWHTMRAYLNW